VEPSGGKAVCGWPQNRAPVTRPPGTRSRSRAPVTRTIFSTRRSLAKSRACRSDFFFDPMLARELARLSLGLFFRPFARSRSRAPVTRIFFLSTRRSLAKSRACHSDFFSGDMVAREVARLSLGRFFAFSVVLLFRRALGNRRLGYGSGDPGSSLRDKNRRRMFGHEMYG
jgi:hypothetical protein